eukprot:CAMPEP_0115538362 /NCGR_PEP_ID=MMETSP0271-20121206/88842_1 /TAXON_ID=71861 /ORGANISM="Scrippsiella trochoidea, Strain CCMP3099" /LENGTH=55 /DNA_ID=CAMNT_0002971261 /DNA_START=96 /DNA_END=259 /DNA_ORIENTATION=+
MRRFIQIFCWKPCIAGLRADMRLSMYANQPCTPSNSSTSSEKSRLASIAGPAGAG